MFLQIDLTNFNQGSKTRIRTLSVVVQTGMQLRQKETGTNMYIPYNRARLKSVC